MTNALIQGANDQVSIHASTREATPCNRIANDSPRVSIHASTREATAPVHRVTLARDVSIHASTREATEREFIGSPSQRFQSTPPRGRRQIAVKIRVGHDVSIHASTREATYQEDMRVDY
ncbi:MAG TPA: hypothetical protein GXX60_03750 [Anaerolineaceae bacterium]|nr:hypothetical protein [Anaerolineaceae bacterium]